MAHRSPIERLIDAACVCTTCGHAFPCPCLEDCSCGFLTQRYTPCRNPETTDCSTKLKYGTPAQQEAWFDLLGTQAAREVLWYIDSMYPKMWANVSKSGARTSIRNVIRHAVAQAIRVDRNANDTDQEPGP